MQAITLQPVQSLISLRSGYVNKGETTLNIECHDRHFRDASVIDDEGRELFTLKTGAPFTSWSVRRSLIDASGTHVCDIRHYQSRLSKWVVEYPQGKKFCIVKDGVDRVKKSTAAKADIITDHGDIGIDIRSSDRTGITTVFGTGDIAIAEMTLKENNDMSFLGIRGLPRTTWSLRVASGVDMAMILALAFCRAEISHAWRR